MSSNYDIVFIEDGLDVPRFDGDPSQYDWQTKSFPDSAMRWHRLTADGQLYRAAHDYDQRGLPAEWGALPQPTAVAQGEVAMPFEEWIRVRYYGSLMLTAFDDAADEYVSYEVTFRGPYEVDDITRITDL